jgi:hypothetical protein
LQEWCEKKSRESLTIEGRGIEPKKYSHGSTPTRSKTTVRDRTTLYGSNVSAKADTIARDALLRQLTTESPTKLEEACLPEEVDTEEAVAMDVEAEAQLQLLLLLHQSQLEPVQS